MPPVKTEKELLPEIKEMHEAAKRGETPAISMGVAGPEEAARIKAATGYDVLLHKRSLNAENVQHAMDRHNQQAAALGEKPITHADIAKYGDITTSPDKISKGTRPGSIIYEKRYADGTVCLVEQEVKGNNIEFRSMWKNKVAEKMRSSVIAGSPARTKGERLDQTK